VQEVYEKQKELLLIGERVVLVTLDFDLNIHHPYKPLVKAIEKFNKVAQKALAQAAWSFVNDGYAKITLILLKIAAHIMPIYGTLKGLCRLRTSLCLQFKPQHIAAGAIFLATKFLKIKLPADGENFWLQQFDVTPRQLEGLYKVNSVYLYAITLQYRKESFFMLSEVYHDLAVVEPIRIGQKKIIIY
jgi:cyclin T